MLTHVARAVFLLQRGRGGSSTCSNMKGYMAYLKAATVMTLGVYTSRSYVDCSLFQMG